MALTVTPDGFLESITALVEGTPFVSAQELSNYTKGLISPTDPRVPLVLAGATAAIQRYAGWHIAPAHLVTEYADGGTSVIYLPTLKLNSVESVTVDGNLVAPADYEWSRKTGNLRNKRGYWPDSWSGTVVVFNSGYDVVPAELKQIVLQVSSIALSSPTGATREQAGQVAMSWATTAPGVSGGLSLLARDLETVNQYRIAKEA